MFSNKIWDFWASRYERLLVQKLVLTPARMAAVKEIEGFLAPKDPMAGVRILDMGCGTGQLACEMEAAFCEYHPRITGVDISKEMVKRARQKQCRADFICAQAENFRPAEDLYDVIVCLNSFPYYHNQERVLANFYAMLKNGGLLVMAQASINAPYDRLIMLGVKLTVSRSRYLSISQLDKLSQKVIGKTAETEKIPVKWFLPSIIKFVWRKS